nr:F-box protein At1g47056-like isoform X1 [Ipomoea batatas]
MADDLVRELSKPTKNRLYIVFLSSQFSYGMLWMGQFVSTAAGAQNQSHRKNLALLVTPMQATEKSDDIIGNGLSDYSFTFPMSVWLSFSSLLTPATVSGAPSCAVGGSRSKDRAGTVSRCALRRSLPPRFLRFFRDSIRSRSSHDWHCTMEVKLWGSRSGHQYAETTDGGEVCFLVQPKHLLSPPFSFHRLPWVTTLIDEAQQWRRRFSSSEVDDIPPSAAVACDANSGPFLRRAANSGFLSPLYSATTACERTSGGVPLFPAPMAELSGGGFSPLLLIDGNRGAVAVMQWRSVLIREFGFVFLHAVSNKN